MLIIVYSCALERLNKMQPLLNKTLIVLNLFTKLQITFDFQRNFFKSY